MVPSVLVPSDDDCESTDGSDISEAQSQRKMACILTVPETFISADSRNKQFYYPQMVSIGPFHYYKYNNRGVLEGLGDNVTARETTTGAGASASEELKGAGNNNYRQEEQVLKIAQLLAIGDMERKGCLVRMEKDKLEAYNRFWKDDTRKDGRNRVKKVLSQDGTCKKIADDYDRSMCSLLTKKEFNLMIRHDAVYLLEFINEYVRGIPDSDTSNLGWEPAESLFSKRSNNLVLYAILMDIMKLENQIPMMVLDKVTEEATEEKELKPKLHKLLKKLSLHVSPIRTIKKAPKLQKSKHLLDCFHKTVCMADNNKHETPPFNVRICIYKLLHWLASIFCKCRRRKKDDVDQRYLIGGAYKIQSSGVTFVVMEKGGINNIRFDSSRCVLWLPRVDVGIWTETLLRNLVAYEACQCDTGNEMEETPENGNNGNNGNIGNQVEEKYVSRFVLFMSQLLDSQRSAEVLKECGVLIDNLGDSERVVQMWNSMSMSRWIPECEVFDKATQDLNVHLSSTLVGYFFEFWELYLSRPWLILLVIVGVITFTASILGVWNPFDKEKK